MHTCTHTCTYTHAHTFTDAQVHTSKCMQTHVHHTHVHAHTPALHMCTCTHTHMHTLVHTQPCNAHVYMHSHPCIAHMYIHTHSPPQQLHTRIVLDCFVFSIINHLPVVSLPSLFSVIPFEPKLLSHPLPLNSTQNNLPLPTLCCSSGLIGVNKGTQVEELQIQVSLTQLLQSSFVPHPSLRLSLMTVSP